MINKWLGAGLLLWALNLCDALFTNQCISLGLATEANPIMAFLMGVSIYVFFAFKISLLPVAVWLGILAKSSKLLQFGLMGLISIYGLIVTIQLSYLIPFYF